MAPDDFKNLGLVFKEEQGNTKPSSVSESPGPDKKA